MEANKFWCYNKTHPTNFHLTAIYRIHISNRSYGNKADIQANCAWVNEKVSTT